jgi:tetratricopeptide (TPR) repeat protein
MCPVCRALSFPVVFFVLVALSEASGGRDESWVGHDVILKKPVTLNFEDVSPALPAKTYIHKVTQERNGKLYVRYRNREGSFNKADACPADDALVYFTDRIENDSQDADAYARRGAAWFSRDYRKQALADLDTALKLDPKLAMAFRQRALLLMVLGKGDNAMQDLEQAVTLDPDYVEAHLLVGDLWLGQKEYARAAQAYGEAIRIDPTNVVPYRSRGYAHHYAHEYQKAIDDYVEAARLDPNQDMAYNNHAWLLCTCPDEKFRDGKKALELAKRACELNKWKSGIWIDTLAAAHAEIGEFDNALKYQLQALKDPNLERVDPKAKGRVDLYKEEKPYRE